ncbi:MAG: class I SAM-dependent methyltransferase [Myxococcota bacterium]
MVRKQTSRGRRSLARLADKYDCYQRSVQEPDAEIRVVERVFARERGRPARSLREDFCGTAQMACAWAARHRENTAIGVDLDPECLRWGHRHNVRALDPEAQSRVKLLEGNVLDVGHEPVDVVLAFNFSWFILQERADLLRYLRGARASLKRDGLLFLDCYGGPEAQQVTTVRRRCTGFTYVWEQRAFDPIGHRGSNSIHFEFRDGSSLRDAFRYDWRLWSLPEVRDLLAEAGFARSDVLWEDTCRTTGEGNDVFRKRRRADAAIAWVAYVVARP